MVSYFKWQQEHDDYLRELCEKGLTSSKISDEMHKKFKGDCVFTRNSVIGRAHRLKIGLKSKIKLEPKKIKTENKKTKKEVVEKPLPQIPKRILFTAPIEEIITQKKSKLGILDLGPNQCRYTASEGNPSDFEFCGKPTQIGKSYCDDHHEILFYKRTIKAA